MNKPTSPRGGPLHGVRVVEFAGLGPAPFACMLLADMGADVVRIDRPDAPPIDARDIVNRGRRTVALDLKSPEDVARALELARHAELLVEGFRPGVMERLGLGPTTVHACNPGLVYGRMTGWGQYGPLAQAAGHDINYIALAGALSLIGPSNGAPVPPLNLVGDYGGGSLYLVMGLLAGLLHARTTGQGQVVDAAICDGVLSLLSNNMTHRMQGRFRDQRGSNMLDGGAPYYTTYETADGRYVSIGPIEPRFFQALCRELELPESLASLQNDPSHWPALHAAIGNALRRQPLAHWCARLEGTDVCFAPVLTPPEAARHPHIVARRGFIQVDGVEHTAPAPRFSVTPGTISQGPTAARWPADEVLDGWQLSRAQPCQ
ncbi:CaiB/BaiF CoA transferase family protein [Hydrogenophaga intermedia]|jgi:alpha-methylacyl-CoA racemase|uniref:CaiB/BaiF CoA transferase family protein n=1 Tax=Hydrogenophaga intermedia TaxID=65786 RepID=UPI002043211D|nr:CaiB/BaiF CoA-transferase family protein [Hydrogenophaga intermedia]MCM3563363.1 CoA transferase [Hydrogenophaga intermedia]